MSSPFPFGTQVADAPDDASTALVPDVDGEDAPSSRRPLLLVLALVVVLIAAGGSFLLLDAGGGAQVDAPAKPVPAAGKKAGSQAGPAPEPEVPGLRHSSDVRDPFDPLVEADTGTDPATLTGTQTAPDTVVPPAVPATDTVTDTGSGADPTTGGSAPAATTVRVKVVAMTRTAARVKVAGKAFNVTEGQKFANGFTLVRLGALPGGDAYYGVFRYKDRAPFDLWQGQSHQVKTG